VQNRQSTVNLSRKVSTCSTTALQYVFISISSTHFLSFYHFCRLSADLIVPVFFSPAIRQYGFGITPINFTGTAWRRCNHDCREIFQMVQLCPDMSSFLRRIVTFLIIAPYEYFSAFGGDILRGFQMHGQERGSYHRMDHFYSGRATLI